MPPTNNITRKLSRYLAKRTLMPPLLFYSFRHEMNMQVTEYLSTFTNFRRRYYDKGTKKIIEDKEGNNSKYTQTSDKVALKSNDQSGSVRK